MVEYNSWEDLQARLDPRSRDDAELVKHELAMLLHSLQKLKIFAELWLPKTGPGVYASPVWAYANLLLKVCNSLYQLRGQNVLIVERQILQEEQAAIPRIVPMMREVCNNIGILSGYFADSETFTNDLKECCVESGIALIGFFFGTVGFLRNDMSTTCEN